MRSATSCHDRDYNSASSADRKPSGRHSSYSMNSMNADAGERGRKAYSDNGYASNGCASNRHMSNGYTPNGYTSSRHMSNGHISNGFTTNGIASDAVCLLYTSDAADE